MQIMKAIATTIALGLLVVPRVAAAQESAPATITVTGQGVISRPPDLATVSVTIVTSDDNAGRALSENNRHFGALSAKLAATGIAASDVTSTSLSSYFNARPENATVVRTGPYGYIVTRNVDIKARAVDGSGSVIDAATQAGATQINGVTYGFRDRPAVERAALAAAVADAYAQAQTLAAAAHVSIERVLRIASESGAGRVMPMPMMMKSATASEAPVPTTISPSDLDISAAVNVTYAIR